jgi:hypothetical protein
LFNFREETAVEKIGFGNENGYAGERKQKRLRVNPKSEN